MLELFATDGHLEGALRRDDGSAPVAFSGVLALLHALEDLDPEPPPSPDPGAAPSS